VFTGQKQVRQSADRTVVRRFLSIRRTAVRAAVVTTVGATLLTMNPAAALAADPWYTKKASPCSNAISSHRSGGLGWAHLQYTAHRASTRKYVIDYATSWAGNFEVCATEHATTPYRITVTQELRFSGSSLDCDLGIEASFPKGGGVSVTCSDTGTTATVNITTTCAVRKSSCKLERGYTEVLAEGNSRFNNGVNARTEVIVRNAEGDTVAWNTKYI